jgi:hypothetical protein
MILELLRLGTLLQIPHHFHLLWQKLFAALVNATTLLAQNQNRNQGCRGRNNGGETTYVDFTNTRPPMFSKADEPLEADDWLQTMEQKFELIQCTEYQKPVFAAQQLRGTAGVWWANLVTAQPAGHRIT